MWWGSYYGTFWWGGWWGDATQMTVAPPAPTFPVHLDPAFTVRDGSDVGDVVALALSSKIIDGSATGDCSSPRLSGMVMSPDVMRPRRRTTGEMQDMSPVSDADIAAYASSSSERSDASPVGDVTVLDN